VPYSRSFIVPRPTCPGGFGLGEALGFGLGEALGFGLGEALGFGDGEALGFGDGEALGFGDGEALGFGDGDGLGLTVGWLEGFGEGEVDGRVRGSFELTADSNSFCWTPSWETQLERLSAPIELSATKNLVEYLTLLLNMEPCSLTTYRSRDRIP
jgi:hypothetical protein